MKCWGVAMLTSSILQILANSLEQEPQKTVENATGEFRSEMLGAAAGDASGRYAEKSAQSGDKPINAFAADDHPNSSPLPGPSLEGLIQMVNKLRKEDQSRVVDVFE